MYTMSTASLLTEKYVTNLIVRTCSAGTRVMADVHIWQLVVSAPSCYVVSNGHVNDYKVITNLQTKYSTVHHQVCI